MRISVFTPSHDPRWLDDCYRSLQEQTVDTWEWAVLLNGGARWKPPDDPRVKVTTIDHPLGVGAAKAAAAASCAGDLLVELDHDDMLTPKALEHVVAAFTAHPDASLVYSDWAQINDDGTPNRDLFDPRYGWDYLIEPDRVTVRAMPPTPHNVSLIWYAPNHIRAYRRTLYDQVGGYNPDLGVLDDQDLMGRLYQAGEFVHIPECLYLQRVHGSNTQKEPTLNDAIQHVTLTMYEQTIRDNAVVWADRHGLVCGRLDRREWRRWRTRKGRRRKSRRAVDNMYGVLFADHVLEAIPDMERDAWFDDVWESLTPGGMLCMSTVLHEGRLLPSMSERRPAPAGVASVGRDGIRVVRRWQVSRVWTADGLTVHANLIALKDPGQPRDGGWLPV